MVDELGLRQKFKKAEIGGTVRDGGVAGDGDDDDNGDGDGVSGWWWVMIMMML